MKIAAAIIAGTEVKTDPTNFTRCLQSLNGYIDKVFVSYNGEGSPPEQIPNAPTQVYKTFDWIHDFSAARNESFQNIHDYEALADDNFDWILWIDTDDTLENGEKLTSLIDSLDENTQGVMLRYDYSVDKETEQVLAVQWRERLFRGDLKLKWYYPIHEICLSGDTDIPLMDGTNKKIRDLVGREVWVYSCTSEGDIKPALAKNIRLTHDLAKTIKIKLDNGLDFSCTLDHKIMMCDGSYKEAKDLKISDSLMPLRRSIQELRPGKFYEHVKHPSGRYGAKGWEPTHRMSYRESSGEIFEGNLIHHIDEYPLNNKPDNLEQMTLSDHCALHSPQNMEALQAGSIKRWLVDGAREDMSKKISDRNQAYRDSGEMAEIGKKISASKEINLPVEEIVTRYLNGETPSAIARDFECTHHTIIRRLKKADVYGNNHKIVSIEEDIIQDVYDLTVESTSNFGLTAGVFVHNCTTVPGTQFAKRDEIWIRHWREADYESKDTRERNRSILAKARRENPEQPRFEYYMANEVYAEAALAHHNGEPADEYINAAIKLYENFIPNAPSPDDAYIAAHQIAELHRMSGDHLSAVEADLQALMIHPHWPDAMVGISQSYMEMQDWDKSLFWSNACLQLSGEQETTQVREPLNDEYVPRLLKGIALENKGLLQEALENYEEVAKLNLTDEVEKKIDSIVKKMSEPVIDLSEARKFERKKYFGSRPEKSICFFTSPLFENWHPDLVKEGGIGGSETAVMEVAKRFAKDGWRTVVFGTPGDLWGLDSDGVEWWPTDEFLTTEQFTVFVSSRTPQVFDADINAKLKLLWCHDVNLGDQMEGRWGSRVDNIDYIIGLTDWHINHMSNLYNIPTEKFVKIPNGIDLSRFDPIENIARQKNKLVWSSSPDRGIDILLSMWPEIKEIAPDAELHVYYGWESIDKILQIHPENYLANFKRGVVNLIEHLGGESAGIYWHGRIGQEQLAKEMMTCDIWPYTTEFLETFCITALEMQAAGVIPITSDLAALKETSFGVKIQGWANNVSYREQFLDQFKQAVEMDEKKKTVLRAKLENKAKEYNWDIVYNKFWDFSSVLDKELVAV